MLGACGEVLPRVVDDVIRAEGANHVDVLGAAYAGHFRTERLGDLHGEGTDTPRGAVDQDLLSGVNVSLVAQSLQRGDGRDRHRSRLLESHTGRFQRDGASLPDGDVLGERPISSAEYLVARLETRDALADRLDRSGKVDAEAWVVRVSEAVVHAHEVRGAFELVPIERIDRGRMHSDQDFVVLRGGLRDVLIPHDIR